MTELAGPGPVLAGAELRASSLSGTRSNQLSVGPPPTACAVMADYRRAIEALEAVELPTLDV